MLFHVCIFISQLWYNENISCLIKVCLSLVHCNVYGLDFINFFYFISFQISVPSKSPKDSLAFGEGYKSDTDLIRHSKTSVPWHSPSDSQIGAHTTSTNNACFPSSPKSPLNITTQAISSDQGTYPLVMSPPSTTVAMVTNHDRQLNLPGSTGFQVTVWSKNGGNIPNIADIFGTPKVPHISNSASPGKCHLLSHNIVRNTFVITWHPSVIC